MHDREKAGALEVILGYEDRVGKQPADMRVPFLEEMLGDARAFMGEDFWSYGVAPNRKVLDYFLGLHHAQGLSSRRLAVDELFHPATYEMFKV